MDGFAIRLQTRTPDYLIDISIDAGNEMIVLLGRQGAGKSVILRAIAGVYTPQFGVIELGDRTVFSTINEIDVSPSDRRVGWIPRANALFTNQSVRENVAFALQKHDEIHPEQATRRVEEVLDMLQLRVHASRVPAELPAEMVQRVCFARALAIDPDILLLDHQFDDLDVMTRRKVRRDFRSLREAVGVPALMATTDLEEAYELAGRIALVDRGRLLQFDTPRTLLMRPVNREVAALTLSVNIGRGVVIEAVDGGVSVQSRLGRLRAAVVQPLGIDVELVIRPEHIQIPGPREELPSENVLHGTLIDVARHGDLFDIRFAPDIGGDPLHISMSDLAFRELGLEPSQPCNVYLPPQAIHLMALLPDEEPRPAPDSGATPRAG